MTYSSWYNDNCTCDECYCEGDCPGPIRAVGSILQTVWDSKRICAKADGKRMDEFVEPIPTAPYCPVGFSACSTKTKNWYDIICVPSSELSSCPVLEMDIVQDS